MCDISQVSCPTNVIGRESNFPDFRHEARSYRHPNRLPKSQRSPLTGPMCAGRIGKAIRPGRNLFYILTSKPLSEEINEASDLADSVLR